MPVNPITLDKIEPAVIKEMENKAIDTIVREVRGGEIRKEANNQSGNFNRDSQEKSAMEFEQYLHKFNLNLEYKIKKDRIKIKIKDKDGKVLVESETSDLENIIKNINDDQKGSIIDIKG
jgi:hypothetical protein